MKKTVMILVLLAVLSVLVGAFLADQYLSRTIKDNDTRSMVFEGKKFPFVPNVAGEITISGTWSCLPSDFTKTDGSGCALGVRESEGRYYFISTVNENSDKPLRKIEGEYVTLTGKPNVTIKAVDGTFVNLFSVDFKKKAI